MDLTNISANCVKCGKCIPSCTIYMAEREETNSPRGFLDLVAAVSRGELALDKNAKAIFDSCFLCTTCVSLCPSALPTDYAIESIRYDAAQKFGMSLFKRVYFFALRHRKFADFVFSFAAFIAPCLFKKEGEKLSFRFFGRGDGLFNRAIFPFHKKSFLQRFGSDFKESTTDFASKNAPKTPQKVAIFIGCIANYNYPGVGESLLKILDKLGVESFVPRGQECCAAPAYFSGDLATTTTLIKKNIAYFESFWDGIDAMLIPEATCAAMVMVDWAHALAMEGEKLGVDNSEWLARLKKLLPKIHMASEWLDKNGLNDMLAAKAREGAVGADSCDSQKSRAQNLAASATSCDSAQKLCAQNVTASVDSAPQISRMQITYHDPCHARKVLGVYKEPRRLLSHHFDIKEMSDSARCCGFGGISMQSEHYALTLKAGMPKARDIAAQKVAVVSAECSACRMQITNALHQLDDPTKFIHPLELVASKL